MKRKIAVTLLCGILAVSSLAGCGNTQVEEAEPAAAEKPAAEEETPAAADDVAEEVVEEVTEEAEEEKPVQVVGKKYICLTETSYNADGTVDVLRKYSYNESGDVIESTACDVNGNVVSSSSYEYEYDANGNKIKETENLTNVQIDLSFSTSQEYEYDANGNMTKLTLNNSDVEGFYTDEYEYDANGNMIKDIYTDFDADGNEESSSFHEYEYDANGNKIKHITDMWFDTVVLSEYENEYDENGNIIKYTCNNAGEDGEVFRTDLCEYKYDDENRLLSEILYDGSGDVIYKEYDEHGNIIRHIQYTTDDFAPSFCIEYKYMELQDYLAAKESIDAEEIETGIANGESIESILSGLGISLNNN